MEVTNGLYIKFDYLLILKGISGHRKVKVQRITYGENEYHPGIHG